MEGLGKLVKEIPDAVFWVLVPSGSFDDIWKEKCSQPEALSCSVWIDSHIYMFRLGLISRRHENQQKLWKYKYTI
jgi:hypothetical protein